MNRAIFAYFGAIRIERITIDVDVRRVKERIDSLGFVLDVDFTLTKVRQRKVSKNVYHFTPSAFKKILLAARPHANHEINVDRYRDYYLFLEEVVGYYNEYQQLHKDRRNAMLTSENVNLGFAERSEKLPQACPVPIMAFFVIWAIFAYFRAILA